jgi:ABC-type multidrug transport system ATPase subunit
MYDELTCEENVTCAGLLFNRRGFSTVEQIIPMVYYVLELLGLIFVRRSPVGNAETKGVSGGQKKRVSVAMEMMKEAPLFLLDEPTSGLDSASSISLFNALHTLASLGHNVVATIHQPRQEIIDLLDSLILLAPGGRMVYCGPANQLAEHFQNRGYVVKFGCNVADFVMDVLAGFVSKEGQSVPESTPEIIDDLCGWWEDNMYPPLIADIEKRLKENPEQQQHQSSKIASSKQEETSVHWTAQFMTVFSVISFRHIRGFQRTYTSFKFTCFLLIVMGMIVSALFGKLDLGQGGNPIAQVSAMQLTFGLLCITFGLKLFRNDSLVRRREEEGGVWLLPYFLGKLIGSMIEIFVYPLVFLFGYYPLVSAAGKFNEYWGQLALFQFAILGLANFVAIVVPGKNSNLVANGALVILWSFGGIEPTLDVIITRMGGFGKAVNFMSPYKWSFEKQMINELSQYSDLYASAIASAMDKFGYSFGNRRKTTGALIAYYVIANALGYLWLIWARDHFKIMRDITSFLSEQRRKYFGGGSTNAVSKPGDKAAPTTHRDIARDNSNEKV